MKFCPVVPEICRGQVHGPRKERRKRKDNDRDIKFDIVIGHHWRSNSAFSKFSRCLPFSKWLPKHGIKYGR
jgi:hypothetical protein